MRTVFILERLTAVPQMAPRTDAYLREEFSLLNKASCLNLRHRLTDIKWFLLSACDRRSSVDRLVFVWKIRFVYDLM